MADTTYPPVTVRGPVGNSRVRTSGREKVTGTARFTADWPVEGLLHAVAVPATICRGRVVSFDTAAAEAMPGVRMVLTPDNAPDMGEAGVFGQSTDNRTETTPPIGTHEVFFAGQFMAAVIADTFEAARDAALAVKLEYETAEHLTDWTRATPDERPRSLMGEKPEIEQGDPQAVLDKAAHSVDLTFTTDMNHHNPIEPHGTIAVWREEPADGEPRLLLYDTTQSVAMEQSTAAHLMQIDASEVRVVNKYTGGAFGAKGGMWPQCVAAMMCAKAVGGAVKLIDTRRQMYGGTGHRTPTHQRVALAADAEGRLTAVIHEGHHPTAAKEPKAGYIEAFTLGTHVMYGGENRRYAQTMSRTDTQQPTFMRAPAETPGMFALECAVNELAHKCGVDPVQFRLLNDPPKNPTTGSAWSGRHLAECLRAGAERFGWSDRPARPRQQRQGQWLIGTGVAAATYPAYHFPTQVRLTLRRDGRVVVECCTQEIGTGTRTVQEQLAADLLGVPADRVSLELGDSRLPPGGVSGGSATTSSVGGAIRAAVDEAKAALAKLAPDASPLSGASADDLAFKDGRLFHGDAADGAAFEDLLSAAMKDSLSVDGKFQAQPQNDERGGTSAHSFGATFVEVGVDEELGLVRVRRLLGCYACGTILNRRTARSQFIGGLVMGVGHALMEQTKWDHRFGRVTNDNLAEYHVPVNADIPDIDVMWVSDPDFNASPIGAKGIGEISITGVAAAVAEAIWHATGRRHRHAPILPHHVLVGHDAGAAA